MSNGAVNRSNCESRVTIAIACPGDGDFRGGRSHRVASVAPWQWRYLLQFYNLCRTCEASRGAGLLCRLSNHLGSSASRRPGVEPRCSQVETITPRTWFLCLV